MIALLGCICGAAAAGIFRKLTDRSALRKASSQMLAHVLEFSLFIDEPRTILKAQKRLLAANLRLLRILMLPILFSSAAFLICYITADQYVARMKLPLEATLVITQAIGTAPHPPAGTVLDSAPVRIARTNNQTWRLRVNNPDNRLGRTPWLASFSLYSGLGAAIYAIFLMARETPNKVTP